MNSSTAGKSNSTRIWLRFGTPKVTIEKEVWYYSKLSFVADCGGLLGLFIGFNFVMIWDLIVIALPIRKLHQSFKHSKRHSFNSTRCLAG